MKEMGVIIYEGERFITTALTTRDEIDRRTYTHGGFYQPPTAQEIVSDIAQQAERDPHYRFASARMARPVFDRDGREIPNMTAVIGKLRRRVS